MRNELQSTMTSLQCPKGCRPESLAVFAIVPGGLVKCGVCGCEFPAPLASSSAQVWSPPRSAFKEVTVVEVPPSRSEMDQYMDRPWDTGDGGEFDKPKPKAVLGTPAEWTPSPDQVTALDGILAWQKKPDGMEILTVGGYAGTGKTALTGRVAYDLISQGVDVAFATPTGKAAQVLKKSLARSGVMDAPVSTIHSLIYKPIEDKKTGRVIGWEPRRTLDCSLIVVDEASMISQEVLGHLRKFGIPILAVGDHGQLPPVGESTGLMTKPDFRLEKIHRQATGNPVIRLSTLVRNGAPNEALKKFIEDINDPRVGYTKSRDQAIEFGSPPGLLLTYTNKLRTSLNRDIRHDKFGYDDDTDPQLGEVIICLKNRRLEDGRVIANGMRGVVKLCGPGGQHSYKMNVEFDEPVGLVEDVYVCKHQFLRDKTFAGFDEVPGGHTSWWTVGALFDFGYAMTCHKSQGSQAPKVAVFMEWALSKMEEADRRRWVYTAATRAVDSVLLVF